MTANHSLTVVNGQVVTPDAIVDGDVTIDGAWVTAVDGVDCDAEIVIDAQGRYVLAGLVDLHGDDIENHLHPRSGVRMDTATALSTADRATVAAGITTKFHAISFEMDESKNRSPALAADLTDAVTATDDLLADHRLHARCEVTQEACVDAVLDVVEGGAVDLVSVVSHIPGKGQFQDVEAFREYYEESANHAAEEATRITGERGDITVPTVRECVDTVVERAHAAGAVTASDDEDPGEVARLAETGVDITEYPITLETAERATAEAMTTAMGAPNLVRGESQWGNLSTVAAIEAGVVDVLVSDYHPHCLLAAVFVDIGEPLYERVRRVTANPAEAVGFENRGRIQPGARADLVVVNPDPTPTVTRAVVAGDPVYRADSSTTVAQAGDPVRETDTVISNEGVDQ